MDLALDALVKGCADVLLTRGEGASLRILLGKRKVEPQPDWWFVGGRTRPGDTPAEGAARNVKRELGLAIETRRRPRQHVLLRLELPPAGPVHERHGGRASTVFELPLTQAEADGLGPSKFDKNEYADAAWVGPLDILEGDYHPALQQAVRDLAARLKGTGGTLRADHRRPWRGARGRFVAWKEAAPLRVQGSLRRREHRLSGRHGAVPRPTSGAQPRGRPPLFALRDVAFYASIAAVAFMAGRRSK